MCMVMYHVASWFLPTFFGPYRSQWVVISTQAIQVAYHKTPQSCTCVARLHTYAGIVDVGEEVLSLPPGPCHWLRDPVRAEAICV